MAEGEPESTHLGITWLPNLVNFARDQAAELVWENGQIGMRGLVSNPSRDSYSSPSAKPQVMTDIKKGMDTIKKSGLLGTADSFWTSKYDISLQEDHHPEGLPELYETNFHMFCENTRNNVFDKYNTEAHVVPVYKEANPGPGDVSKRAAKKPKHGTANSSKLYQAVTAHNRSIVSARQSGTSKQLGLQKYSFLRPEMLDKADGQSSDDAGTRPASRPSSSRRQNKPVSGLKRAENSQGQADLPIPPIFAETPEEVPPDEQSEAVVPKDANIITSPVFGQKTSLAAANTGKSPDTEKCLDDQVAPTTSNGSRGASNDPTYFLKTSYEDTELKAWTPSDQSADEEQGGCCSQKAAPARSSAGAKRRRSAQVHNMSERRRRDKINKKMRELRDLVPNSNKVDNASMLDQAIEYTKILQLQLQMMSMGGAGFCMPSVMLATGMQHLQSPNSANFLPVSLGIMGMRMPMGVGYSMAPFGFPGQVMPMSMPRPPFIPLIGGPSHFTFPSPNISSAATPSPFLGSPSMLSYTDSVHPANSSRQ